MHSCLPDDKHNVASHFRLQAFLSEQSFPSLPAVSCSSAGYVILLFFINVLAPTVGLQLGC